MQENAREKTEAKLREYKSKISAFYDKKKRMPSYAELAELIKAKSKDTAYSVAEKLIESGMLGRDDKGKLIPGYSLGEVKVLGVVEAGFPSPAEETVVDTMSLDDYLIRDRDASFMLKVKGDSMIDAGIREGDMVIVERGKVPRLGDIVIARVDGEFTMKYYRIQNGTIYLEPANKKYKPIYPSNELTIEAVVTAVVRKLYK